MTPRFTPHRLVLLALLLFGPPAAAQSGIFVNPSALARVPYEPHMCVRLLPGHDITPIAKLAGCTVVASYPRRGLHLLKPLSPLSESQLETLCAAVKWLPIVVYAEPDVITDPPEVGDCGPSGTTVGVQQCTIAFIDGMPSPTKFGSQFAMTQIQAPEAHSQASGAPLLVSVIDTGVDLGHTHLQGHIAEGGWDYLTWTPGGADVADGLDNDGDSLIDEGLGHGTHVAGLVLLSDHNAMILPMRAMDNDGNGSGCLVAMAIYDSVDRGAVVINMSLSMRVVDNVLAEALMYAEYHGVIVVTSAGNANQDVLFPASYNAADFEDLDPEWLPEGVELNGDHIVGVSGVDDADIKAQFACFGPSVDLCAPAVDVYSSQMNGTMAWWSGTSMSSGIGSGAVSFLLSIWDGGSYAGTVLDLLKETAFDLDGLNPAYEQKLGAGRIQLGDATSLLLGAP